MGVEIERKFLVVSGFHPAGEGVLYRQGYLSTDPERVVRVRLAGESGFLTIKGRVEKGCCPEYEYPIPAADAAEMLDSLCAGNEVRKTRYRLPFRGYVWEVDVFEGVNRGLVLAEVEMESIEARPELPEWIDEEVTGDRRYFNACLSECPFSKWS